jgi:hypothetical protein
MWVAVLSLGAAPNLWAYQNKKRHYLRKRKGEEKQYACQSILHQYWIENWKVPLILFPLLAIGSLLILFTLLPRLRSSETERTLEPSA